MSDETNHQKPNYVMVMTIDNNSGEVEQERIIDHHRRSDRTWLGKHSFWALCNGKAVLTAPVKHGKDDAVPWF